MSVIDEARVPTPRAAPPGRSSRRRGWRDLRGMLVTVVLLLLASAVAVAIAYATKGSSAPAGDVQASTIDFKVVMPTTLKAGKHLIGFTNKGAVPHEFVIFKTKVLSNRLPLDANGDVNEDSPLLTNVADSGDELKPGGTKSVPTASLAPGHYVALCNLPGHYHLGMRLDVTVP